MPVITLIPFRLAKLRCFSIRKNTAYVLCRFVFLHKKHQSKASTDGITIGRPAEQTAVCVLRTKPDTNTGITHTNVLGSRNRVMRINSLLATKVTLLIRIYTGTYYI